MKNVISAFEYQDFQDSPAVIIGPLIEGVEDDSSELVLDVTATLIIYGMETKDWKEVLKPDSITQYFQRISEKFGMEGMSVKIQLYVSVPDAYRQNNNAIFQALETLAEAGRSVSFDDMELDEIFQSGEIPDDEILAFWINSE